MNDKYLSEGFEGDLPTQPSVKKTAQRVLLNLLISILIVFFASALRIVFFADLGRATPYLTYYPAVVIGALISGLSIGLITTFLSVIVVFIWIKQGQMSSVESWAMVFFAVICTTISWLSEERWRANKRIQQMKENLEELVDERTEKLRKSEERFRNIMEQSPLGIVVFTPEGQITHLNSAWMRLWGINEEEAAQVMEKYNFLTDKEAEAHGVMPLIKKAFSGESVILPPMEYVSKNTVDDIGLDQMNPNTAWVQCHITPVKNENNEVEYVLATNVDITQLTKIEEEASRLREEYLHISRVNSIGELAASLAHELKQPLAAIRTNAQAAQRFLTGKNPDFDEFHAILTDIIKDNRRADQVIVKLRNLMRKDKLQIVEFGINELIQELLPLIHSYDITRNISLEFEPGDRLPSVAVDRVQIQQVILNLLLNSSESLMSISEGMRKIVIQTSQKDTQNITVAIKDNGPGIDKQSIDHLFEPFYTTKKEGLGMGLAISKSIVEAHNGSLWAENNSERGATFYFTIPEFKGNLA